MDFLTQALLAVVYAIATSALEKAGERVGDTIYEKFLGLLEQRSPNTAIAIRRLPEEPLDYGQLFWEIKSETETNTEFAQTARQLASTAKEHPLPNLDNVLQKFAVVEELKPRILELQSLISVWKKKMVNIDEIKQFLPDATDEQTQRYATQLKRLGGLESFFSEYPQELNSYQDFLARARKAFNYKQPYRIAVIGTTGAGKSTMLNAMLGRELVLTKSVGKAATGAALEIFLDVSENQDEKAVVTYRDEDNIQQLVREHFIRQYQLDESQLSGELDESFAAKLSELSMTSSPNEQTRKDFENLREILVDLTEQYRNTNSSNLRTHFSLTNSTDVKELMELIDENSDLNRRGSNKRMIGLVKSVTYHINPDRNSNSVQTLQLPNNVCLVDLPGLDGSPLHDIIISEGIKDADAVIFIMRPPRILGRSDDYLLDRVSKYISLKGEVESGERIFLMLNAKDSIANDNVPIALKQDMGELMTKLLPEYATSPLLNKRGGETPYFMTSALAAYYAQKKIKGEQIGDCRTYKAIKLQLRVQDNSDEEVLQASQVPKLVEELTKFARDKRIEGQIRDGKQALDSIINPLYSKYVSEYRRVIDNQGQYASQKNIENQLEDQRKVLEKILLDFRGKILNTFEKRRESLEDQAKKLCDEADDKLRERMPGIWKKHFKTGNDVLQLEGNGKVLLEPVLSDAQVELWENLNQRVPELAISLTDFYKHTFQQYQVVQHIVSNCFGSKEITEIEAKIKQFTDGMDRTMVQIAKRIAMTTMTNPVNHFTAFENKEKNKQLVESLSERNMLNENLSTDKFVNFITEVRKLYNKFISGQCVIGLLNLYRYEMLAVERDLFIYIEDIFTEMRNQIPALINSDSPAPVWLSKMRACDPNWEQEVSLKSKISTLSSIKE